ncbi:MAG TPA: hypothetical protein VHA75_12465 [Rugosimonospora sp.]|nr:hypothetical protein [Rugosimonospora sp.]
MEQRGSAAEPFSSPYPQVELPTARLQAWARRAAELGAIAAVPTQETVAA